MWQRFLEIFRKEHVQLNSDLCLRTKSETSTCTKCEEVCPQPALSFVHRKIKFDQEMCSGCRLCVHVCPTEALQVKEESLANYEAKIKEKEVVSYACKEHGAVDVDIIVPCVSTLTPEMVMIPTLYNKKVTILWNEKICFSCHSNWSQEKKLDWIHEWNANGFSKEKVEIVSDKSSRAGIKQRLVENKVFFSKRGREKKSVLDALKECEYKATNKLPLSERRMYMLAYIKRTEQVGTVPKLLSDKIGLANLEVTDNCLLCTRCSNACPTGALQQSNNGEELSIKFSPYQCVNCDICVHNCLELKKVPIKFEEVLSEKVIKKKFLCH